MASRPVLILEGKGDIASVPFLLREMSEYQCFPVPRPMIKQSVKRLSAEGELERFARYALTREEGDSVLFLLDADEDCAKEIADSWTPRLRALNPAKKVGVGIFVREFEAYFLACLDLVAEKYPDYGLSLDDWGLGDDHEAPRDAKGRISGRMKSGKTYKPALDQAKFVSILDFARLRHSCRSFRHLESLLAWLGAEDAGNVYPA